MTILFMFTTFIFGLIAGFASAVGVGVCLRRQRTRDNQNFARALERAIAEAEGQV